MVRMHAGIATGTKRFRALTMPAALQQVRAELGADAVILETRRWNRMGQPAGTGVEVFATADPGEGSCATRHASPAMTFDMPRSRQELWDYLIERELPMAVVRELVDRVGKREMDAFGNPKRMAESLVKWVAECIPTATIGATGNKVGTLVGPAGSGKTTVLAGLAARAIHAGARVALVSCCAQRLSGGEDLRRVADILGARFENVSDLHQLPGRIRSLAGFDRVWIEAPARLEPEDAATFLEMNPLLVLPITLRERVAHRFIDGYRKVSPQGLILTRLDESPALGVLVGLAHRSGLSIHFVADGPTMPRSLQRARPFELAKRILCPAGVPGEGGYRSDDVRKHCGKD